MKTLQDMKDALARWGAKNVQKIKGGFMYQAERVSFMTGKPEIETYSLTKAGKRIVSTNLDTNDVRKVWVNGKSLMRVK